MKKSLLALIALAFVLILAACGGTSEDQAEGDDAAGDSSASEETSAGNALDVTASNFEFDQAEYTVKAGEEVSISFANEEGMHGFAIDEFDVNIEGDGDATFTPDEPGEYTIYCSIPCGQGHDDMKSTLIVE